MLDFQRLTLRVQSDTQAVAYPECSPYFRKSVSSLALDPSLMSTL